MKMIQLTDNLWVRVQDITRVSLEGKMVVLTICGRFEEIDCKDSERARTAAENIVKELEELE